MFEFTGVVRAVSSFVEPARNFTFGLSVLALALRVGGNLSWGGGLAFLLFGRWLLDGVTTVTLTFASAFAIAFATVAAFALARLALVLVGGRGATVPAFAAAAFGGSLGLAVGKGQAWL